MKPKEDRPYKVLIVDDSVVMGQGLTMLLSQEGFVAQSFTSIEKAKKALADQSFDLVITDPVFASSGIENIQSGIDFIQWLKRAHPRISILALSGSVPRYLGDLSGLGVPIIAKEDTVTNLTNTMRAVLSRQVVSHPVLPKRPHGAQREVLELEAIRRVFTEEAAELLALKEQTLTLPGEGTYDLPKPLQGFKKDIERHILKFPFEQNVFLMMKFRPTNRDVADYIIETATT